MFVRVIQWLFFLGLALLVTMVTVEVLDRQSLSVEVVVKLLGFASFCLVVGWAFASALREASCCR